MGDAEQELAVATAGLLCGQTSKKQVVARYWLLRGAVEHFAGRKARAADAFVAAYRADPTVHIAEFGKAFDQAVEVAVLEAPREFARLKTDPPQPDADVWVNGQLSRVPVELLVGSYTVQLVDRDRVVFAEIVKLRPGVEQVLQTGVDARPGPAVPPTSTPQARDRSPVPVMLIASAIAGGLAAGSGALYLRENSELRGAEDVDALYAARDRQVGFGVAGATLAGIGVIGVGLHFAVR